VGVCGGCVCVGCGCGCVNVCAWVGVYV